MGTSPNTPASASLPTRLGATSLSLLLAVLGFALNAPGASAADPVTEVASTAAAVTAAAAPGATAPPTAPAAEAAPPTAAPTPAPVPDTVAATVTTVQRSVAEPTSATAEVTAAVSDVTQRTTSTGADAVTKTGQATHVPVVEETARSLAGSATAVENAAGDTVTRGSAENTENVPASPPLASKGSDPDRAADQPAAAVGDSAANAPVASQPSEQTLSPPSPSRVLGPSLAIPARGLSSSDDLAANSSDAAIGMEGLRGPSAAITPTAIHGTSPEPGAVPHSTQLPAPPIAAASASSPAGGGPGGASLLFLGMLALLTLVAPRTPTRLLRAGRTHRPAPFICALERPG